MVEKQVTCRTRLLQRDEWRGRTAEPSREEDLTGAGRKDVRTFFVYGPLRGVDGRSVPGHGAGVHLPLVANHEQDESAEASITQKTSSTRLGSRTIAVTWRALLSKKIRSRLS